MIYAEKKLSKLSGGGVKNVIMIFVILAVRDIGIIKCRKCRLSLNFGEFWNVSLLANVSLLTNL